MSTFNLFQVAVAALFSAAHPPAVDLSAEAQRLEVMASAIVDVVVEADELADWIPGAGEGQATVVELPFSGPDARVKTVLALASIAIGESRLSGRVERCEGTRGARTSYQLLGSWARGPYTWDELCASPRLAAERALWALSFHAARCGERLAWRGYAAGDCGIADPYGDAHRRRWERMVRRAQVAGFLGQGARASGGGMSPQRSHPSPE